VVYFAHGLLCSLEPPIFLTMLASATDYAGDFGSGSY
jgi:hypothetical protein